MLQLLLTENQVNIISLVAIFGGQVQAKAIGFKHLPAEKKECSTQS